MLTTTDPNDCGDPKDTDELWKTIHQEVDDCQTINKCDERQIYPQEGVCEAGELSKSSDNCSLSHNRHRVSQSLRE